MEQSPNSGGGSLLNSASSCNSAARFLHAFLCTGRCAIWQSRLQYFTILHAVQAFKPPPLSSPLPQLAHMLVVDMMQRMSFLMCVWRVGIMMWWWWCIVVIDNVGWCWMFINSKGAATRPLPIERASNWCRDIGLSLSIRSSSGFLIDCICCVQNYSYLLFRHINLVDIFVGRVIT